MRRSDILRVPVQVKALREKDDPAAEEVYALQQQYGCVREIPETISLEDLSKPQPGREPVGGLRPAQHDVPLHLIQDENDSTQSTPQAAADNQETVTGNTALVDPEDVFDQFDMDDPIEEDGDGDTVGLSEDEEETLPSPRDQEQ